MKAIVYILKVFGAFVYSLLSAYLLWLLFCWATPHLMSANWFMLVVYLCVSGGFLTGIVLLITNVLSIPVLFLRRNNIIAKITTVPAFLLFGYSSIRLPYNPDISFSVLQWIIAISISVTAFITFVSMIGMSFIKTD